MDHERPKLKKLVFSGTSDAKQSSESAPEIQSKSNEPILASATSVHSWPAVKTPVHLDLIKSHSSGVLKFSPEISYEFTAEDLLDLGEIGQGCFGSVYKMLHKSSQMLIAVKVSFNSKKFNIQG
uniref:Uncharacterized protein n=1 Tax=Romanomermis culicivorax TaxID=13658 RepID=A0A915HL30_ROMCU